MIREIDTDCTFSSALSVDALSQAIPAAAIAQVIAQEGGDQVRERRLTMMVVVWLIIALHRSPTIAIDAVLGKLVRGPRFIWPDPSMPLQHASAIAYRRTQVGA